jgi:hypothetical protein
VSKVRCAQALPSGQILLPLLLEEAFLDFLEYAMLPSLTGPIPGREFVFCSVTRVPSPEVLAATGLVFFYGHVLVAKPHNLYFAAFFCEDGAFFRFPRRPFWFVKSGKRFTPIFYAT